MTMVLKRLHILIVFFICEISFTQNHQQDSIVSELEGKVLTCINDSIKVDSYIKLGSHFLFNDFSKSENYYKKALAIIEQSRLEFKVQKANIFGQLGVIFKRKGDYSLAMDYYLKSKNIFEELGDTSNVASILHNVAMIHRDQRSHTKALHLFKEVILLKNKLGDKVGEGIAYNMKGVVHRKLKRLDSAAICYEKAKQLFIEEQSLENIPRVYSNFAALFYYKKEYKKAIDLHLLNIEYFSAKNNLTSLFSNYFNLSKIYLETQKYHLANDYIDKAINIAKKMDLKDKLSRAYLRKSTINSALGNHKEALIYHKLHKTFSDSIYNKANVQKIQKIELTHSFEKQRLKDSVKFASEKRIVELEKEKVETKNQLYFLLLLVVVLLGIISSYLIKKHYKKKVREDKKIFKEKEQELKKYTEYLLYKIDEQEEKIKRNEKDKEALKVNDDTKALHDKIAGKILTHDDWYNFKEKFNQVYPLFFSTIKENNIRLTKSEERLVALEKLGLDNNQIAKVLGISVDSVFVNRYRLRKKIKAPTSISTVDFLEKK